MKENDKIEKVEDLTDRIIYKDKEYQLVFNLNTMQEIQKQYGTIQKWGDLIMSSVKEPDIEALCFGLKAMLNEGIDIKNDEENTNIPFFTIKQVGRILTEVGLNVALAKAQNTVVESTKSDEKN